MFTGIIVTFLFQLFGSDPRILVSEETTVITSPLRADGLPDYQQYWRDYGREGVTFENNAAIPFWQAIWPGELSSEHWLPLSEALGFDRIPSPSNTLQDPMGKTVRDVIGFWLTQQYQDGLAPEEADKLLSPGNQALIANESVDQIISRAMNRPWRSADVPPLADWVARNTQPLALLHEATTRPKWWSPSPSLLSDKYEGALMILLPGVQSLRTAARRWVFAMWHAGEGRRDDAWSDIKARMQFARFSGEGVTLVEQLVAIAIDNIALRSTVTLLQHGEPDAKFAREVLDYLKTRKLPCDVVKAFDKGERVLFADTVVSLRGDPDWAEDYQMPGGPGFAMEFVNRACIDWNQALREATTWYDRLVTAGELPTRAERTAALEKFDDELSSVIGSTDNPDRLIRSLFSGTVRAELMSDAMISLLLPAITATTNAQDRAQALLDLTRTAAALAVYRAEHSEYPETLEQLVPSILPKVPLDLYTDKPFHYQRMPDGGYLLYSMFENGTDDGGTDLGGEIVVGEWVAKRNEDITHDTSDLVIRVPVPKFELPQKPEFVK